MATITATPGLATRRDGEAAIRLASLLRWTLDHKLIGLQYMASSLFFFVVGGAMAMLIRWELLTPTLDLMADGTQYNALMTMHGSVMIFLWIIPMMAGFGNYLVPLMLGAKDMAFPWLNAFAFWLIPPAGVLLIVGWLLGPAEAGWTAYPPLSTLFSPDGQTMWAMALHLLGLSSILGAINFIVTIRNMRPAGMTYWKMPLFVWAVLATAIIQVLATPFLTGGLTLLILDRVAGTSFFDPGSGGDVLLWQNVFWFYSHPAVYIMILPGFGMVSEVLSVHARKPVFGYRAIALSSLSIALVGFTVWAHHLFTSLQPALRIPFMITSMIIAVPTGIKIFSWLGTIWGGKLRFNSAMLFALGFISLFVFGGIGGVMLASVPVDIHLHDTYFVVGHFHFTLFGGSVFLIFAGIYHWFPKMTGRRLDERLGKLHFWMTYIGFFFTFMPQHIAGALGMPRRIAIYDPAFTNINQVISLAAFLLGIASLVLIYNLLRSLQTGERVGGNPWRALTLEWATTSPPPPWNFRGDPVPFDDPYGYGSDEGLAYLDAVDRRFPAPTPETVEAESGSARS